MADLKIFDLYKNYSDSSQQDSFLDNVDSKVQLKVNSDLTKIDSNWIEKIEETLPYIANAIDKPNKLLINNEEILQIEKTKKVTVDSIKHLSKHTNLIQEIDEDNNVVPNKILNVLKEETLTTYENRFIYTLVLRINDFITNQKQKIVAVNKQTVKEKKELKYSASTTVGKENIDIDISINSNTNAKTGDINQTKNEDMLGRISALENKMMELMNTQNFKLFEKSRFLLVTPPLRMTNALLKNPNLQCAVKLWNYLIDSNEENASQQNLQTTTKNNKLKRYIDESFLLNYIILNNYQKKDKENLDNKFIEIMFEDLLEKALGLDSNISEEKIKNIINKKYRVVKNKIIARNLEIEDVYKKEINKYADRISEIKI